MSPASRVRWSHAAVAVAMTLQAILPMILVIGGCGGSPRRAPAATSGAPVDPRACGKPASEPDARAQAFLAETLALEARIASSETALRDVCAALGRGLGLPRATGSTAAVCNAVVRELHGARGTAAPAESAAVAGEASGHAQVGAPAPAAAIDTRREAALRLARTHLPDIARVREQAAGPLQTTLHGWGRTAADLLAAGPKALGGPGARAACVFDQLVRAAARLARMQASLTTQREASAAIQAAAGLPTG